MTSYEYFTAIERGMPACIKPDDRLARKIKTFMTFAMDLARLSSCKRLKVGAIVVPYDLSNVISVGYNGPPAGLSNESCIDVAGGCGCIHAEANAVLKMTGTGPRLLLCTHSPCGQCAGLIVNSSVIRIVSYREVYRVADGVHRLHAAGIETPTWRDLACEP